MRSRGVALVALCLVATGLALKPKPTDVWQWRSIGEVYASDGNPITFNLSNDPCAGLNAQHALIIAVSAEFFSPKGDQTLFQLGDDSGGLRLDLAPSEFYALRLFTVGRNGQQIQVIGRQSWQGTRDFVLILRKGGDLEARGGGLHTSANEVMTPPTCATLVVGGAPGEGDFQGRVRLSYVIASSESALRKSLSDLGQLDSSRPWPWQSTLILAGLAVLLFLGTRTLIRCREVGIELSDEAQSE